MKKVRRELAGSCVRTAQKTTHLSRITASVTGHIRALNARDTTRTHVRLQKSPHTHTNPASDKSTTHFSNTANTTHTHTHTHQHAHAHTKQPHTINIKHTHTHTQPAHRRTNLLRRIRDPFEKDV